MEALQLASHLLLATNLTLQQPRAVHIDRHLQCSCGAPLQAKIQVVRRRCRAVWAALDGEVDVEGGVSSSKKSVSRRKGRKSAAPDATVLDEGHESAVDAPKLSSRRRRSKKETVVVAGEGDSDGKAREESSAELSVVSDQLEEIGQIASVKLGALRLRSEYRVETSGAGVEKNGGEGPLNLREASLLSWVQPGKNKLFGGDRILASSSAATQSFIFNGSADSVSSEVYTEQGWQPVALESQGIADLGTIVEKKKRGKRSNAVVVGEGHEGSGTESADNAGRRDVGLQHSLTEEQVVSTGKTKAVRKSSRRSRAKGKVTETGQVTIVDDKLSSEEGDKQVKTDKSGKSAQEAKVEGLSSLVNGMVTESDLSSQSELSGTETDGSVAQEMKRRRSRKRSRQTSSSSALPSDGVILTKVGEVVHDDASQPNGSGMGTVGREASDLTEEESVSNLKGEQKKRTRKKTSRKAKAECLVHWSLQAQLKEGQRLFLSGSAPELGSWDLASAVAMSRVEGEGCWEAQLQIASGTSVEYNYFLGSEDGTADIVWRPGALLAFQVPSKLPSGAAPVKLYDVWALNTPENVSSLLWGEWWDEIGASSLSKGSIFKDRANDRLVKNEELMRKSTADKEEQRTWNLESARVLEPSATEIGSESKEPPVDSTPSVTDHTPLVRSRQTEANVIVIDDWLKRKIRRKVLPREEPWLLESELLAERQEFLKSIEEKKKEQYEVAGYESQEHTSDVVESRKESDVRVEILINAPESTMQRMAILEDGKLAELLIEPVNSKVQVGNIYLGSVKQLLPGMIGVFVDIGSPRLALLDITRNIYPCTFPSITPLRSNNTKGAVGGEEEHEEFVDAAEVDQNERDSSDDYEDETDHFDEAVVADHDIAREIQDDDESVSESLAEDSVICAEAENGGKPALLRGGARPLTVNFGRKFSKWRKLEEGMKIIVQVKKEAMGKKGPRLTAYPSLAGRFWVVVPNGDTVGISQKISGPERARLRAIARNLQPEKFGLTVRTEAMGHSVEELEKDLARLCETWNEVMERAEAAAVAAQASGEESVPVLLHRAMGQTLTVVRDFFNDKVHRMVLDSLQSYQEVTSYLAEVAPNLVDRVELYSGSQPIFDAFNIESQIDKFASERVQLSNGAYLVVQETEALVSIDVNGGIGMLNVSASQRDAILEVNLAAARQIATELRLRDVGGIIIVDFIDMDDPKHETLVYEEMRKAIARDRSKVSISEISEFGVMELTRRRVRPSVTVTISDPCSCCRGVGRVESRETTLAKIERAIRRRLAETFPTGVSKDFDGQSWPQVLLRVDPNMFEFLKSWKSKRVTQLSSALKVWINLKVAMEFSRGQFQVLPIGTSKAQQRPSVDTGILGKRMWTSKRRRYLVSRGLENKTVAIISKDMG